MTSMSSSWIRPEQSRSAIGRRLISSPRPAWKWQRCWIPPSSPLFPTKRRKAAASSVLAKARGVVGRNLHDLPHAEFVPFTAQTRMSGVNLGPVQYRKGAAESVLSYVGGKFPSEISQKIDEISQLGGTPLVVATRGEADGDAGKVYGVIYLKDVVKGGLADRFARFRAMGIRTVMITGDNQLTAAAIAKEAGVDEFLAQATPEDKLALIRKEQEGGRLIAMTGDGTNDAPALAQADVGVAMNTGTQAAKEAGNMIDLDSNPTKLIEIVEIGKQLLMTRGALTTFSIANDVAKYFAIIPAMLMVTFPAIAPLNVMHLVSPNSAILSAVIFNAVIIIGLIPLALRGVQFKPMPAMDAAPKEPVGLRRRRSHRAFSWHQSDRFNRHLAAPDLIKTFL